MMPFAPLLAVLTVVAATAVHIPVTTGDARAQALVDQGLFYYYAYNREAAESAFRSAVALDPTLALAYWGEALAYGPDLNTSVTAETFQQARLAVERAVSLEGSATPLERALIDAQARRYRGTYADADDDNAAYRKAMLQYANSSRNETVQLLAAEALLEHESGSAAAHALVRDVLARDPANPMANHLCIHVDDEASNRNDALPCAQRLDAATFPPAAEHLAHMPAHYWIEAGDYAAASNSSERAYALLQQLGDGSHANQYAKHDVTVGYSAAMMLGNYATAQTWSKRMDDRFDDGFTALTALRFGRYDIAFAAQHGQMGTTEIRGLAALRLGRVAEAHAIGSEVRREVNLASNDGYLPQLFMGRLAEAEGRLDEARRWLEKARDNERAAFAAETIPLLPADEALGGFYLREHMPANAVDAFERGLEAYPNDPRALYGLALAFAQVGRADDASRARARFEAIWIGADTTLTPNDL